MDKFQAIDTFEEEAEVDIFEVQMEIDKVEVELKVVQREMDKYHYCPTKILKGRPF